MIDEHKNMKLKLNSFIASKSVQLSQPKNKTSVLVHFSYS